jgi:polysaccharide deacetylase 2 family uncharacterized protein YibQ
MHRRQFIRAALQWTITGWLGLNGLAAAPAAASRHRRQSLRIALIIDDIGFSRSVAKRFLEIPADLTYAVLPHLPFSHLLAHEMRARGHEVLLHQPMEPFDARLSPGPGAVYVGDSLQRIQDMVGQNIHSMPHIVGVNNHMGSRFTSSNREILTALQAIKREGLFFVDSLTSHQSCAYRTARRIHMDTGRRDTFLDNSRRPAHIIQRLYQLVDHALFTGSAIGIGHPYPETAAAIHQFCTEIQDTGVEIVPISSVLVRPAPSTPHSNPTGAPSA